MLSWILLMITRMFSPWVNCKFLEVEGLVFQKHPPSVWPCQILFHTLSSYTSVSTVEVGRVLTISQVWMLSLSLSNTFALTANSNPNSSKSKTAASANYLLVQYLPPLYLAQGWVRGMLLFLPFFFFFHSTKLYFLKMLGATVVWFSKTILSNMVVSSLR